MMSPTSGPSTPFSAASIVGNVCEAVRQGNSLAGTRSQWGQGGGRTGAPYPSDVAAAAPATSRNRKRSSSIMAWSRFSSRCNASSRLTCSASSSSFLAADLSFFLPILTHASFSCGRANDDRDSDSLCIMRQTPPFATSWVSLRLAKHFGLGGVPEVSYPNFAPSSRIRSTWTI